MKRIILILLTLTFMIGVGYSQAPIKRKKKDKTEQTQASETRRKQEEEARRKSATGIINGHEWVDLGLSVKWATCNIGASKLSDYGNYYAWGEIKPKSSYNYRNCFDRKDSSWDVYKLGGKTQISPTSGHDVARENWGNTWRMPTTSEMQELNDKCKWKWTKMDGHNGYLVTGPNGKSIFLPAAGYRVDAEFYNEGEEGLYWSSSLSMSDSTYALSWYYSSDNHEFLSIYRSYGLSVRAVTE